MDIYGNIHWGMRPEDNSVRFPVSSWRLPQKCMEQFGFPHRQYWVRSNYHHNHHRLLLICYSISQNMISLSLRRAG